MNVIKRLVVPVLGTLLLAGCAGGADSNSAMEATCVISGEPAEGGPTAHYMGQTVHFCCDKCKAKWDGMSDEAKKAKIAN